MNHLSLFSGIGGIDLAAHWAGMTTVAFCEQNKFCQKVLAKHWPNTPIFDDIHTLTAAALWKRGIDRIDIISGGFPCQPYSVAGKQRGAEDDRALWPQMLRIVKECKPRWIVGENVAGIINMALDDVLFSLEAEGYEARTVVLPASAVGAWHIRQRVFIVAHAERNASIERSEPSKKRGRSNEAKQTGLGGVANVAHTNGAGCEELDVATVPGREALSAWESNPSGSQWATEPEVGRVANGIPRRLDRLRSLGNAVVPQQIYPIMESIMQIEAQP